MIQKIVALRKRPKEEVQAEQELLERIERLLKTRIEERQLTGFDASSAGHAHQRSEGRPGRSRSESAEHADRPSRRPRADREERPARVTRTPPAAREDAIFDKPYESGTAAPAPVSSPPSQAPHRTKPKGQVAALFQVRPSSIPDKR